eukprot:9475143-Pyramimonas_sp.AAC.1
MVIRISARLFRSRRQNPSAGPNTLRAAERGEKLTALLLSTGAGGEINLSVVLTSADLLA